MDLRTAAALANPSHGRFGPEASSIWPEGLRSELRTEQGIANGTGSQQRNRNEPTKEGSGTAAGSFCGISS